MYFDTVLSAIHVLWHLLREYMYRGCIALVSHVYRVRTCEYVKIHMEYIGIRVSSRIERKPPQSERNPPLPEATRGLSLS